MPKLNEDSLLYYVAIDMSVHKESKHFLNGINYHLIEMVEENGLYKINRFSNAPVDIIETLGVGFGTSDELEMAKIDKSKYVGKIINRSGKVIETNKADSSQMKQRRGGKEKPTLEEINNELKAPSSNNINEITISDLPSVTEQHVEPSWIDVYLTGKYSQNTNYYKCSGCVRDVDFYHYQTDVLPNEWVVTWLSRALQSGALCVKMYGWYAVKDPLHDDLNADIRDDTYDQVYKIGTSYSTTNSAIDAMGGIGLHRKDNSNLFLTRYKAGTPGLKGTMYSGIVEQEGTQVLAKEGKYVYEILGYYYNNSSYVGGSGKIFEFFTY